MDKSILEEYQITEYSDDVAAYTFHCEGGGVSSESSYALAAQKPGIRLHFFRYGLFQESSKQASGKNQVNSYSMGEMADAVDELKPKGVTKINDFFCSRTAINEGYIYVIIDENKFLEYKVDEYGYLHSVSWSANKDNEGNYLDIRKETGGPCSAMTFQPDTVIWIAFSPVQWSLKYLNDMLSDTDGKRTERMEQIKCTGFKHDEVSKNDDILPFNQVTGSFLNDNIFDSIWFNQKIKEIVAEDNTIRQKEPEALKEDMFITLHDPMGVLSDVSEVYGEKILQFKALTEAIQTGETQEEAFSRVSKVVPEPFDTSKNVEHQHLFALANFCYHHIYDDVRNAQYSDYVGVDELEKYQLDHYIRNTGYFTQTGSYRSAKESKTDVTSRGVDFDKLVGILGIDERTEERKKLISLRDEFYKLFKGKYVFKYLDDYLDNIPQNTVELRYQIYPVTDMLYLNPYNIDAALLLNHDRQKHVDDSIQKDLIKLIVDGKLPGDYKIRGKSKSELYSEKETIVAMLAGLLDAELPEDSSMNPALAKEISMKMAGIVGSYTTYCADKAFGELKTANGSYRQFDTEKLKGVKKDIVDKINSTNKINNQELLAINESGDIISTMKKEHVLLTNQGGTLKLELVSADFDVNDYSFYFTEKLTTKQVRNNKYNSALEKAVNTKAFNKVFGALAIINISTSLNTLVKDPSFRNYTDLGGYVCSLSEVALNIKKINLTVEKASIKIIKRTAKCAKIAGAASAVITGAVCIMDGLDLVSKNDDDAAIAMIGAGIGFAFSGLAPFLGLSNPIGLGLLIIGTGLYFLAKALTDDEYDKIYNNFLLSDYNKKYKKGGLTPMEYAQLIFEKRSELTREDYRSDREDKSLPNYEDPYFDYIKLLNQTVMPTLYLQGQHLDATGANYYVNKFRITIPLYQYFNYENSLDNVKIGFRFFPELPESRNTYIESTYFCAKSKEENKLIIDVDISEYKGEVSADAYCIVYFYMYTPSNETFPYKDGDGNQEVVAITAKLYKGYHDSVEEMKGSYYQYVIAPPIMIEELIVIGKKKETVE